MKITLAVLLALVFVCGCLPASANATYTDGFDSPFGARCCQVSPWGWAPPPTPLLQYDGSELVVGFSFANFYSPEFMEVWMQVDFSALVSNFSEWVYCGEPGFPLCNYQWSGTFNAGKVNIAAKVLTYSPNPTYTYLSYAGKITGGTFWGAFENYCGGGWCGPGYLDLRMNVDGTWSNGWTSSGLLTVYADSDGPRGTMTLTTNTVVPEPGTLGILSSGLMLLAGGLRRKLLK